MFHKQHLTDDMFRMIRDGLKKLQFRLNDEKRQGIQVGDYIQFINRLDENAFLYVKVTELIKFKDFEEAYENYGEEVKDFEKDILLEIYSDMKVSYYGVLAIHFEIVEKEEAINHKKEEENKQ